MSVFYDALHRSRWPRRQAVHDDRVLHGEVRAESPLKAGKKSRTAHPRTARAPFLCRQPSPRELCRWMVRRPLLICARRNRRREQGLRFHGWGHPGGHQQVSKCNEEAAASNESVCSARTHPCHARPAQSLLHGAACSSRAPNAIPTRGAGAGANADAKERAVGRHPRFGERRDLAAAHARPRREAERAGRAGRGRSFACRRGPAGASLVPCAGAAGTAVTASPEGAEARREALPARCRCTPHRCMHAISRTYRTLYVHV